MIKCFFSPPGSGKTSVLTLIARREYERAKKGKSKYWHIYTNYPCQDMLQIKLQDLGKYYVHDSLIILDEVTLDLDSRQWKEVSKGLKDFICLHRHLNNDIIYAVQDWSRAEKTLREQTVELYYLQRSPVPFFNRWVTAKRIFRKLTINEFSSEITLGYRFSDWIDALFQHCNQRFYLPKSWQYFDTNDTYGLDLRPEMPTKKW